MYVDRITLKNYRNYRELKLSFNPSVNIIYGKNAQGKTNLLESVSLAAFGKSFRTQKDRELIRFGEAWAKVDVRAKKESADTDVAIYLSAKGKTGVEKRIKKDGKQIARTSELLENIYIVIFSPEDLKIIKEDPEKRRRFIDRELCQISPRYYYAYRAYKRALLQRNAYLKEEAPREEALEIWDRALSVHGASIILMRANFISQMSGFSAAIHGGISGGTEKLEIRYEPNFSIDQLKQNKRTEEVKIEKNSESESETEIISNNISSKLSDNLKERDRVFALPNNNGETDEIDNTNNTSNINNTNIINNLNNSDNINNSTSGLFEKLKESFYNLLQKNHSIDIKNHTTMRGPHRDDMAFFVNNIDMRDFGSQGQQRTAALSLKLAEVELIRRETGESAILLLDDVMSELDVFRQEYLIDTMKEQQMFITITDLDDAIISKFENLSLFYVENGEIIQK